MQTPDALVQEVYDQLRKLAASYVRRTGSSSIQPTALVHEAWLKIERHDDFADREHFAAVAATAMRQILIDRARSRGRLKRSGDRVRTTLTGLAEDAPDLELVDLARALEQLEALDPRGVRVVELRWFGGLTAAETARALGVSTRTVEASWRTSRAWLLSRLRAA